MNWVAMLGRLEQQTRQSPIIDDTDLLNWTQQGIRVFDARAQWLENWHFLIVKTGCEQVLLPDDHLTTVGVWYNGVRLQRCTAFDAQLVSPTGPVYYHEDNWSDWASGAGRGEFATHYELMGEFWPLQLGRAQSTHGRKTLTLIGTPTSTGTYSETTTAPTISATSLQSYDLYVLSYTLLSTTNNVLIVYKQRGTLPQTVTDTVSWSDGLAIGYMCQALSYALTGEDDEYDRYRAWMYGYLADAIAGTLKGMAISRRQR